MLIPVQRRAQVGSRDNICVFGTSSGRNGGPIVVITEPLEAVLRPSPQVGRARSLTSRGAITVSRPEPAPPA